MIFTTLALFGCRDPKITSYRVPKEAAVELPATAPAHALAGSDPAAPAVMSNAATPAGTGAPAAPASHGLQTASAQSLVWSVPATWQSKAGSSMRKATYVITGEAGATAELAVTAFPGDVGGEIANLNRWRGQVGLEPVNDSDARAAILRIEANGLKIGVVDVADPSGSGTRLIGAMVPVAGATWFFKLLGPDAIATAAKPAFLEFVKTIKPADAATS